jgi:hypothetical protein
MDEYFTTDHLLDENCPPELMVAKDSVYVDK